MTRDDIIKMAREAGLLPIDIGPTIETWQMRRKEESLVRFAALVAAAEREKVAAWMMERGYATGHGDTIEELLKELEWQISEKLTSNHTAPFVTDKRSDKTDTRKSWTA
jgi:hypothetical protein